jgi:hypothetical protein
MPRAHSWRGRIPEILAALENVQIVQLGRSDVETLFAIQRRAALRLMEALEPSLLGDAWRVDRSRLVSWLTDLASQDAEENTRSAKLRQGMRDAAAQKMYVKAELRRLGRAEPASWSVAPEAFTAKIDDLPREISFDSGRITLSFPGENPVLGAKLLHELSLAMLGDWEGFCSRTGIENNLSAEERIDRLLWELEAEKSEGVGETATSDSDR